MAKNINFAIFFSIFLGYLPNQATLEVQVQAQAEPEPLMEVWVWPEPKPEP